ncbi:MAG: CoA transferase, partial [Euzebyales bacterium]|nr:CoA transferase [Euzebyales bacterium]
AEDIAKDPHFRARSMLEKCEVEVEPGRPERISFPGVVPKLSRTPGRLRSLGPELGQHNDEIYGGLLGMEPEGMEQARRGGVI